VFLLVFLLSWWIVDDASAATDDGARCREDLEAASIFLASNDSGAATALADRGSAISEAYAKARESARNVADAAECDGVLRRYLRAWRSGHIGVVAPVAEKAASGRRAVAPGAAEDRTPTLKVLDDKTVLLSLPTFRERYKPALQSLLSQSRRELEAHKNWIIDVRANDGGADTTYRPLLSWLLDSEYPVHQVEWYVTPANIRAQEDVCSATSEPAICKTQLAPVVAAMRAAKTGDFVLAAGARVEFERFTDSERDGPSRVVILMDHACASSCEQFLLAARASFRVKLVGRPSAGTLDVSNLRPHPLPSGRTLFYATSRSTRLPDMPIDEIGIQPDILLPGETDSGTADKEIERVRRWMAGGSLDH
jgi:hypothetical protein